MTIKAEVVLDSVSPLNIRLTTMCLKYPRFIHSEFMTHRQFSRNASSSRAIPVSRIISDVKNDPAMPVRWGRNGKGMQDHGEMSAFGEKRARELWLKARDEAVAVVETMMDSPEPPHKQIANRLLEPFSHITVLVTATEWHNFFALRCHPDADPTMKVLADTVHDVYRASTPSPRDVGDWHLPYIEDQDIDDAILHVLGDHPEGISPEECELKVTTLCQRMSVSRCARVSYLNHDGKRPSIAEDLALFEKLIVSKPMHASPAEHQATPDWRVKRNSESRWANHYAHGNLFGWQQYRKMWVGEVVPTHSVQLD